MGQGFYRHIVEARKAAGCQFRRPGKGDHEIWYSSITDPTFTVDRGSLSRHTANAVMKQAGIEVHF